MAVIGVGLDLVELARVERALSRFGAHFLNRIFTEEERARIPEETSGSLNHPSARQTAHVAARFAAKEAAVKALGTGFSEGVSPRDVEVKSGASGKPELVFRGKALDKAGELGVRAVHLTLTHTRDNAAAVVIIER